MALGPVLAYSAGNLGKSTVIGALELTSLFYLTDLIGVPPGLAGSALFAVQLANAATDAAVGQALDRLDLYPYRAGPFILAGAALALCAFSALYALPILCARSFALAVTLILFARLAISLLEVPHIALLMQLAPDSRERTRVSAYRFGFSTLGIFLLSFVAGLAMDRSAGADVDRHILIFGIFCGTFGPAVVAWSWWRIRPIDRADRYPATLHPPSPGFSLRSALESTRPMWHRDYVLIFLITIISPFCTQLFFKSVLYEALYVLHDRRAVQLLLPAMMTGQFIGVFLWSRSSGRMEKARAASLSFVIIAAGFVAFYLLARVALGMALSAVAVVGIGVSGASALLGSMAADCCDLARIRGARSFDATALGTLSCVGKISSGLCALALGWGLSLVGYFPNAGTNAAVVASIHAVSSLIPTAAALACAALLLGYRLSYASHAALIRSSRVA